VAPNVPQSAAAPPSKLGRFTVAAFGGVVAMGAQGTGAGPSGGAGDGGFCPPTGDHVGLIMCELRRTKRKHNFL